ncbi:MAG TPA: co-chaperone GroES family protein [Patescibacteria group bacterium]|jgi:chaperonin GroES
MKNLKPKQLKPLAGYVLIEPAQPEEKTSSGIILPTGGDEKPQYGTVLAVGESDWGCDCGGCCGGCHDHEEKKARKHSHQDEAPVKIGDAVIYKKWGGNEVMLDEVEYQFLKFEDILAVVDKK